MKDHRTQLKSLRFRESLDLVLGSIDISEGYLLKAQLVELERENNLGLLQSKDYRTELNRIIYGWHQVLEALTDDQIQQIVTKTYLNIHPDNATLKLRVASLLLREWKSDFENLPGLHLDRPETKQILNWVHAPLADEQKGIALLIGDAGTGKSVVLGDVLRELEAQKIPTLGIKADQECAENVEILAKKLQLDEGIEATIRALALTEPKVVVLIDQIDALSQALSIRCEYLTTITRLVAILGEIPNVRVVLSCRTYDFQNDHNFNFYQRQKQFKLGKLEIRQIKTVLEKISPGTSNLPSHLLELLQAPLYLNVFCQIYRHDLHFAKFKALRDLYEELWFQRIDKIKAPAETNVVPQKCAVLISEMARTMYERSNVCITANLFRSDYLNEMDYLKSIGILTDSRDGILFFHQTFYEFAFAKQFVKSEISVEKYLLENHQNLHVRASLKMILEFLREHDPHEYLQVNRSILISPEFYFHIKFLLLSLLGFAKNPSSEEMRLVRNIVFTNFPLFKAFVAAVNSREWLLFLFNEKQLLRLVEYAPDSAERLEIERFESRINILNSLLLRHLPESQAEVLAFLNELPEYDFKPWLVERSLNQIKIWENLLTFKLFDTYRDKFADFIFRSLLEKAAAVDLAWAVMHLRNVVDKVMQAKDSNWGDLEFDYELSELIRHFIENYPEPTFDILYNLQIHNVLPAIESESPYSHAAIVNDLSVDSLSVDGDEHDSTKLCSLLINCVQILARSRSQRFSRFIQESSKSLSATKLLILVEGFRANPVEFSSEVANFLQFFIEKRGFDATESLSWRVRQLLKEACPHFSDLKKGQIIQCISQIESKVERDWALMNDKPDWIGLERFKWLKCLPSSDLTQIPSVERMASELAEQFSDLVDDEPNRSGAYWIGPPMEQDEYDKMTLTEWKDSFSTYDENYKAEWASAKGDMEQHAQKFEKEVKKHPEFFFPLIEQLALDQDLPLTYLIHGLDGLKAAKYSPELLLFLFKKIDYTAWGQWHILSLLRLCGYFVESKIEDDDFFHFLIKMSLEHPDPVDDSRKVIVQNDETKSIFSSGYNTVRGYAANVLPHCYYFKKQENMLFETLEQIAEHDSLAVRCQLMPRLALLTNLDRQRTLRLFLRLVRDREGVIIHHSAWSAQYLARQDFEGMLPYFEIAFTHSNLHKNIGIILSLAWIFDQECALEWLNRFVETSDESVAGAIEVASHNICDEYGQPILKSIELFGRFLDAPREQVIHAYGYAFRHLNLSDFIYLKPTLVRFTQTIAVRKNPRPFYAYLISCAQEYPAECLELIENFDQYERPDIRFTEHYDNEPIKVVLNAYQGLWGRKVKTEGDWFLLKKALLIFDQMLLDDRFHRNAESVLEMIER